MSSPIDDHAEFSDTRIFVPDPASDWFPLVNDFALTFNAYNRVGETSKVSAISRKVDQAIDGGLLAEVTLDELRTTLFFYQRRTHHNDVEPSTRRVSALLTEIIARTGGTLPGPGDPLP